MKRMRSALEKTRKAAEAKKDGKQGQKAAKNMLAGRTNFNKVINEGDHSIIQLFKDVAAKQPMKVIKDPENDLGSASAESMRPFVLRKGRNISKFLVKDDAFIQFSRRLFSSSVLSVRRLKEK